MRDDEKYGNMSYGEWRKKQDRKEFLKELGLGAIVVALFFGFLFLIT